MSKKSFKLSDLDFNNIGGWPQQARIVFCMVVGLFILVLAWFLLISSKRDALEGLEATETQLRTEFETQQGRAVNLE
ncbi:type 4a pilus biogenesis protein PilO, partial [Xanthomonas fragariae]